MAAAEETYNTKVNRTEDLWRYQGQARGGGAALSASAITPADLYFPGNPV
jgi:hypothetical protein